MSRQRHCQEGLMGVFTRKTFLHMEWDASEDSAKTAPVGQPDGVLCNDYIFSFSAVRHPTFHRIPGSRSRFEDD